MRYTKQRRPDGDQLKALNLQDYDAYLGAGVENYFLSLTVNPAIRFLVRFTGQPTQRLVRSFPLMTHAYAEGAMAFGLLAVKKSA